MKSYCVYKYEDGICGIFEDQHSLLKTARSLHVFQPDGICKEPPPGVEVIDDKLGGSGCVLNKGHMQQRSVFHINRYARRWGIPGPIPAVKDTNRG